MAYLGIMTGAEANFMGLTKFCAGRRYTMLFLRRWQGSSPGLPGMAFPYSTGFANQSMPADYIDQLKVPMLMIHGTYDQADIYRYITELNASGKYFELKVYQDQPHGFMPD